MNKPSRSMVSLTMLVVVFIALPWILPAYYLGLVTTSLILAILAMSANLLLGYLGLASVGQAAFFGIASYSVAIGVRQADFGSWSAVGTGLLAAVCAGLVFGPLAIRTRDIFFLVIMLAFCQIMYGLTYSWRSITGGDDGLPGLLRPVLVPGVSFDSPVSYYFLALAVFLLVAGSFWLLVNSPFGLTLKGIRDSETRMRVLGYNVWFYKYIAFVVAALMGGISGILNAYYYGCPSPGDFSLIHSSSALLMVILGGPGTLFGPLVGSLLIVFIRDIVSSFTDRWLIVLGLAYVLTVLFCPDGLLGTFGKLRKKESDQRERPSGPQPSENTEDVGSPEPLSAQKS